MTEALRPDFSHKWANTGDVRIPTNTKIDEGWTTEIPVFQWENFAQNRQDTAIVHLFQKGISLWSATETYYYSVSVGKAYVQGSDGNIYVAVASSTNQDPTLDSTGTYWAKAFSTENSNFVVAGGIANAYTLVFSPARQSLPDGLPLRFKVSASNTGASTLKVDGLATYPIIGLGLVPLQGGELPLNGIASVVWSTTLSSWVLLHSTGGALQVATATQAQHAITLNQTQTLVANSKGLTYVAGNTTLTSGTWLVNTQGGSFTLTLPLNPVLGTTITLIDASATWGTNNFTLARNGKTIMGQSSDLTVNVSDQQFSIWYNGSDWRLV